MTDDYEKITFNELCKLGNINVPQIFLDAIKSKYTPIECVQLLSEIILTNDNLIDKYIISKNKNGLIKS